MSNDAPFASEVGTVTSAASRGVTSAVTSAVHGLTTGAATGFATGAATGAKASAASPAAPNVASDAVSNVASEPALVSNTSVSLCSYVYNDGNLLDILLLDAKNWSVRPTEIIIVDDASKIPYSPPPNIAPQPKVIRLPQNSGPGIVKATGMNNATCDFILSMDCDMRISNDWLENMLPLAGLSSVGMVGASAICERGDDLVSNYLAMFGSQMLQGGEADFLTGCIWLMRRAVWQDTGGFRGYSRRTHEDHHFCNIVKSTGLKLVSHASFPAYQARRLSRHAVVQRFWSWTSGVYLAELRKNRTPDALCGVAYSLFLRSFERIEDILQQREDAAYIYFELLFFCYSVFDLFKTLSCEAETAGKGRDSDVASASDHTLKFALEEAAFKASLAALLAPYPKIYNAMLEDLSSIGIQGAVNSFEVKALEGAEPSDIWEGIFASLTPLGRLPAPTFTAQSCLGYINEIALKRIFSEDIGAEKDFSFYQEEHGQNKN